MNKLVSACVCNQIFSHTHTHIYPDSDPRPPESKGSEANFSTRRHFGVEEVRANFGPLRIIITVNINIWLLVGRKTNLHVWLKRAMGPDVGHCTKSGRERESKKPCPDSHQATLYGDEYTDSNHIQIKCSQSGPTQKCPGQTNYICDSNYWTVRAASDPIQTSGDPEATGSCGSPSQCNLKSIDLIAVQSFSFCWRSNYATSDAVAVWCVACHNALLVSANLLTTLVPLSIRTKRPTIHMPRDA